MLSDSPPERDLEWSDTGIKGAWHYLGTVWRMVTEIEQAAAASDGSGAEAAVAPTDESIFAAQRTIHQTIAGVTRDLEKFHFNRAVARIRQLTNELGEIDKSSDAGAQVYRTGLEIVLRLLTPMTPHICAELWGYLNNDKSLFELDWPQAEQEYLTQDSVTLAVQVNGKKRATIKLPTDHDNASAESAALADVRVQRAIAGMALRKVSVVKGKIVNVVV